PFHTPVDSNDSRYRLSFCRRYAMTLRTKLWLLIIASTVTGFVLLLALTWGYGVVANQGYTHTALHQMGTKFADEAVQLAGQPERVKALIDRVAGEHPQIRLEWFSNEGQLLYSSDGRVEPYTFDEQMARFENMPFNLWESGKTVTLNFAWEMAGERHYLFMSLPSEAMQSKQIFFYMRHNSDFIWFLVPLVLFVA